jgi:hypothetical protein
MKNAKNKKVHACTKFNVIIPLCSVEKLKDGMSGFIREEDIVIYQKTGSKKLYLRICLNAPVYECRENKFMISICKIEDEIEIEADPGSYFSVETIFDGEPEFYSDEIEIAFLDYIPDFDFDYDEPENEVNRILTESVGIEGLHRSTVNYFYSAESDENGMQRLIELVPEDIKLQISNMFKSKVLLFKDEIEENMVLLKERIETMSFREQIKAKEEIENFKLLDRYLKAVKKVIEESLKKETTELKEENLSIMGIDDLIEMERIEENPEKKDIIRRVLTKKCQGG